MPSSGSSESIVLADWAEEECRHLDLVGSWEILMGVYAELQFIGPDTDEQRLAEFKFIITEINKFLTRMKNGLSSARTIQAAIDYLVGHVNTKDMNAVKGREQIAYNKLKQQWIRRAGIYLTAILEAQTDEGEEDDDR